MFTVPKGCECKKMQVCPQFYKVTVLGACGHLGRALAFQLKQVDHISLLALYDLKNSRTLALDLSHINTPCKVYHFYGEQSLQYALRVSKFIFIFCQLAKEQCG